MGYDRKIGKSYPPSRLARRVVVRNVSNSRGLSSPGPIGAGREEIPPMGICIATVSGFVKRKSLSTLARSVPRAIRRGLVTLPSPTAAEQNLSDLGGPTRASPAVAPGTARENPPRRLEIIWRKENEA